MREVICEENFQSPFSGVFNSNSFRFVFAVMRYDFQSPFSGVFNSNSDQTAYFEVPDDVFQSPFSGVFNSNGSNWYVVASG